MIAHVRGTLIAKSADRVVVETAGGVGYEVVVPLGVMERLPPAGGEVTLATELVVREDGWALYGFLDESERRFFQRLTSVSGVGPKIGIAPLPLHGRSLRWLARSNPFFLAASASSTALSAGTDTFRFHLPEARWEHRGASSDIFRR